MEDGRNLSWCAQESVESGLDYINGMHSRKSIARVSRTWFSSKHWCWYVCSIQFLHSSESSAVWWSGGLRQSCQNVYSHVWKGKNKASMNGLRPKTLWPLCQLRKVYRPLFFHYSPFEMIKFYLSIHWKMSLISCGEFTYCMIALKHLKNSLTQWICWLKVTSRRLRPPSRDDVITPTEQGFCMGYTYRICHQSKSSFNAINTKVSSKNIEHDHKKYAMGD